MVTINLVLDVSLTFSWRTAPFFSFLKLKAKTKPETPRFLVFLIIWPEARKTPFRMKPRRWSYRNKNNISAKMDIKKITSVWATTFAKNAAAVSLSPSWEGHGGETTVILAFTWLPVPGSSGSDEHNVTEKRKNSPPTACYRSFPTVKL